jgi:hypothetical protein
VKLDLVLDRPSQVRLQNLVTLVATAIRSEMELASGAFSRYDLGAAAKQLAERGVSERNVPPGRFPPGVFKRSGSTRLAHLPYHRMSWMTSLLPHLGQDSVHRKIDFDKSWQDPTNWLAARTIVPQFLDPNYPLRSRFSVPPGLGVGMAATHVVGITGIGLDAAEQSRDDPAHITRRGVFSYDGAASLQEIQKGRGLSSTMVMAQIPHDGPGGVAPWIAGGGATLRGVPEKNSIAPFVLTNDANGKPITYNGKRGTFVAMADGSIRFVTADVSDEVFKAMATINGPSPEGFDINKSDKIALVPRPEKKDDAPAKTDDGSGKAAAPVNLTGEAKAFHDGVVKTLSAFQKLESEGAAGLLTIAKDKAKFEAALNKVASDAKSILQEGRQLKAPPGKEGQEYFDAFKAMLDLNEQAVDKELKQVVELLQNPTPEGQQKLLAAAQEKLSQHKAILARLTTAQQAFLRANQPPNAGPQAPATKTSTPAGWITFQVPDHKLTVAMPLEPKRFGPNKAGGYTYLTGDPKTQNRYSVTVNPLASGAEANPEAAFKEWVAHFTNGTGAVLVTQGDSTFAGRQSADYVFNEPMSGEHIHVRIVLLGGGHMAIVQVASRRAVLADDALAYMQSLSLGN